MRNVEMERYWLVKLWDVQDIIINHRNIARTERYFAWRMLASM
jgi:hypothetical protein